MSIKITSSFKVPQYLQEMMNLYTLYSDKECKEENLMTPLSCYLQPLTEAYAVGAKKQLIYNFIQYDITSIEYPNTNTVIVCCSGGKDSTALAIKLKELGYNIQLYYVKGANKSYPEEEKCIPNIANYLQVPYFIETRFKFSGHSDFPDNPIKNQLLIAMALNYAHEINYNCNIAFGDFQNDTKDHVNFMTSWSDSIEMHEAFKQFIKYYIPNYNYIAPFKSEFDTINIINTHYDILPLTQSCVTPYRFRQKLKTTNENKYNIILPEHRCGSCYKCCREYIYFYLLNQYKLNKEYYLHCLDILKKTLKKQHPEYVQINNKIAYEYYVKLPYKELNI